MIAELFGASIGVGIRLMANYTQNTRLMFKPWHHAGFAILGAYGGKKYMEWQDDMLVAVNEARVEKGYKPITMSDTSLYGIINGSVSKN